MRFHAVLANHSSLRRAVAAFATLAGLAGIVAAATSASSPAATFADKLRRSGRAETRIERQAADPMSGEKHVEKGKLVLELPDRVSITFSRTGERLTLRGDGGEWLQPPLKQMITLDSTRAAAARRWWRLLVSGDAQGLDVQRRSAKNYDIVWSGNGDPLHVGLELGSSNLPSRLQYEEAGGQVSYHFLGWAFGARRGAAEFRQKAPAGYTVSPLP